MDIKKEIEKQQETRIELIKEFNRIREELVQIDAVIKFLASKIPEEKSE